MKNDNMKKNGQFLNVRVEYGFGAVCPLFRATCTSFLTVKNEYIYILCFFLFGQGPPPPLIRAMPERKHFFMGGLPLSVALQVAV